MIIEITHRLIAQMSLAGMGLDVIGGFYLAYDLLGGKQGPLRTLARTVGYIALFFTGHIVLLGLGFALVASIGMGVLLTIEYRFAATYGDKVCRRRFTLVVFGVLRGAVLGIAGMTVAGTHFGALFGLLTGVGLSASYLAGFSPTDDYETNCRPRISRRMIPASACRMLIVGAAGVISGLLLASNTPSLVLGLKLGLAAGTVSTLVGIFSPPIEWWIENLPERRLGAMGLGLIFVGMVLQSAQYWVAVWDVPMP